MHQDVGLPEADRYPKILEGVGQLGYEMSKALLAVGCRLQTSAPVQAPSKLWFWGAESGDVEEFAD